MSFERDNIPDLKIDRPWKWLLVPGLIAQWLIYMFPASGLRGVASDTRLARSPLMTYVYSAFFYIAILGTFLSAASHR